MVGIKGMKWKHDHPNKNKGKGWINSKGYVKIKLNGKDVFEHKIIWIKHYGEIPKGFVIHHKDIDRKNNNIRNLIMLRKKEHDKLHWKLRKGVTK